MINRVEKIIGSAEKNRVGREPEPQVFFLGGLKSDLKSTITKISWCTFYIQSCPKKGQGGKSKICIGTTVKYSPRTQELLF
jgi:hypothetical protein